VGGIGSIDTQGGDVTVNIYNGTSPSSPSTPPTGETPTTPPTDTTPTTPTTPTTGNADAFTIDQRANTISLEGGPSIKLFENTVDTLDKKASTSFTTDDDVVGGHLAFSSGDSVWAAQKEGVSVVYWDPKQSLKDSGTKPMFEFYAKEPVTIDGESKQGRLEDKDYIAAVESDQLPKLTGLPAEFQSVYDEMLDPTS